MLLTCTCSFLSNFIILKLYYCILLHVPHFNNLFQGNDALDGYCKPGMRNVGTQTDEIATVTQEVQTVYQKEVLNAKIENMILKNKMKLVDENQVNPTNNNVDPPLNFYTIKNNDKKMKLFTGLTFDQFQTLFEFLGESVNNLTYWDGNEPKENVRKGTRKMEPQEELFLTLVRLRRGYSLDSM